MIKIITVGQLLVIQDVLDKLNSQHVEFNINTSIKLNKLKKDVDYMCSYIIDRMVTVIPNINSREQTLTDEESVLYNTILSSDVELDNQGLVLEDITVNKTVKLDMDMAEHLELLF